MAYNIPDVDGVPNIAFAPSFESDITLLLEDATTLASQLSAPQWGIFLNGSPVIVADSTISIEYRQEWLIADYPVENGAFASYNKVQVPFDARVRFAAGGTEANRAALLASIAAIAGDLNLYDVVTPEATYSNCNVSHYDYHRASNNGVGLLVVDVWLQQIQQATTGSFQNTTAPSGASPVNGGTVQASNLPNFPGQP